MIKQRCLLLDPAHDLVNCGHYTKDENKMEFKNVFIYLSL